MSAAAPIRVGFSGVAGMRSVYKCQGRRLTVAISLINKATLEADINAVSQMANDGDSVSRIDGLVQETLRAKASDQVCNGVG